MAPIIIRIHGSAPDPAEVASIVEILSRGGVVAYPTDTLYGLAADPRSDGALERLFAAKERDEGNPVPLIAADLEQAREVCRLGPVHLRLARAFWPGPLTLVGEAGPQLSPRLLAGGTSVAVRVPAHAVARAIARAFGFCITATSANRSGDPAPADAAGVAAAIGSRLDAIADGGPARGGAPSTLVGVRDGAPVLLRAGAIDWDRVLESLQ